MKLMFRILLFVSLTILGIQSMVLGSVIQFKQPSKKAATLSKEYQEFIDLISKGADLSNLLNFIDTKIKNYNERDSNGATVLMHVVKSSFGKSEMENLLRYLILDDKDECCRSDIYAVDNTGESVFDYLDKNNTLSSEEKEDLKNTMEEYQQRPKSQQQQQQQQQQQITSYKAKPPMQMQHQQYPSVFSKSQQQQPTSYKASQPSTYGGAAPQQKPSSSSAAFGGKQQQQKPSYSASAGQKQQQPQKSMAEEAAKLFPMETAKQGYDWIESIGGNKKDIDNSRIHRATFVLKDGSSITLEEQFYSGQPKWIVLWTRPAEALASSSTNKGAAPQKKPSSAFVGKPEKITREQAAKLFPKSHEETREWLKSLGTGTEELDLSKSIPIEFAILLSDGYFSLIYNSKTDQWNVKN